MYWESTPHAGAENTFDYHLSRQACVGLDERMHLMGGVGLGAGIWAMEQTAGAPILWASVQFVSTAFVGADCTIKTEILHDGRRVAHSRATIMEGDRPIHFITGSHAKLSEGDTETFTAMPDMPSPEDCPERGNRHDGFDNLVSRIEMRVAKWKPKQGLGYLWFRSKDGLPTSAPWLAVLADFMPAPHPATNKCTSLDNTLRIHNLVQSEWILGECYVSEYRNGYFHGSINLFAQDGTLLATGNQTGLRHGT